jgi:hypothetical protein
MWQRFSMAAALIVCSAWTAAADKANEVGILTCTLGDPPEASGSDPPTGAQTRNALCTFRPKAAPEETYSATIQGVSFSADPKAAVIWVVKTAPGALIEAGLLEQTFTSDRKTPADQTPPLIGETNADIALHSMLDKSEGSAGAAQKPAPTGFVILGVEFKLKSASG